MSQQIPMSFRHLAVSIALLAAAATVRAEDLVQIYREAQQNDPALAELPLSG